MEDAVALTRLEKKFKVVYILILLLFSIEFIGEGWASVYRVLIFPLLLLGCSYSYQLKKNETFNSLTIITCIFLAYMALCLGLYDGNILFPIFTMPLAIVIYGFNTLRKPIQIDYPKIVVWYSFPQILSFLGGFANYSESGRFCGLHYDPNFCGIFLSLSAISGIALLFRKGIPKIQRIVYGILLFLSLILMFLSGSRGAMLSFFAVLFFFFLKTNISVWWKVFLVMVALYCFKLLYDYIDSLPDYVGYDVSMVDFVLTRFKPDSLADGSHRTYLWTKVMDRLSSHGSLFVPLGRQAAMVGLPNAYTHNTYLDFLVEIGVVPGVIFILTIFVSSKKSISKYNKLSEAEKDYLICSLAMLLQLFFLSAMSQKIIWLSLFYVFSLRSRNKKVLYD